MLEKDVMKHWFLVAVLLLTAACSTTRIETGADGFGSVERSDDDRINAIIPPQWQIEKLAEGFTWSEGPVWVPEVDMLLFNDVPENVLYQWTQQDDLQIFMNPASDSGTDRDSLHWPGANGLFRDTYGAILMADSGNRSVVRLELLSKAKTTLASTFNGRRFNGPNDLTRKGDGTIYFTDPTYALKGQNDSPDRELPFNGVYRLDVNGAVTLVDDQLSMPNGIALSPDERTLYVSNSDPARPIWMAYTLDENGQVTKKRKLHDASNLMGPDVPGLPDGMTVAKDGTLFATAPGGVLVLSAEGRRLGRIRTGTAISNCTFGQDGHTLFMTSHQFLARIKLLSSGISF